MLKSHTHGFVYGIHVSVLWYHRVCEIDYIYIILQLLPECKTRISLPRQGILCMNSCVNYDMSWICTGNGTNETDAVGKCTIFIASTCVRSGLVYCTYMIPMQM